ncbi:MAG: MATE family efflux transporter [Sphaerochaetaceae bacterium]|nr:MATE family efflux transporter [Spirochaetales bacterium]MDY5498949.1 MATE family efflux transporter [Sphaerochaetaceae bacterium]
MSLAFLQEKRQLSRHEAVRMTLKLSWPTILAQLSSVFMQYIDASMVGRLGPLESAAIGLVASSTWLLGGLSFAFTTGFIVLVAQQIGARDERTARNLARQGILVSLGFGLALMAFGLLVSPFLPYALGGEGAIVPYAVQYFQIVCLSIPLMQLAGVATGMIQSTGHMRFPGVMNTLLCFFDVCFNMFCIFPSRTVTLAGLSFWLPGAGLGVAGAALGTLLSYVVVSIPLLFWMLCVTPELKSRPGEKLHWVPRQIFHAIRISIPVAIERLVQNGAQVVSTRIVSPLGATALAANSFAVTAESVCYMPAYGVQDASSTIVGQCVGAKRPEMAHRLAWLTTILGMLLMVATGALMFLFAPEMIGLISPDEEIRALGARVLRIEAFAEPMFGASIIITGAMRGAGDTVGPTLLNLVSMWLVRIPLSALLAPHIGLVGVWIAMCVELNIRGILFLIRLAGKSWLRKAQNIV